jgi:hypothetical protein
MLLAVKALAPVPPLDTGRMPVTWAVKSTAPLSMVQVVPLQVKEPKSVLASSVGSMAEPKPLVMVMPLVVEMVMLEPAFRFHKVA